MLEDIQLKDYAIYWENFTCSYIVEYKVNGAERFLCKKDTMAEAIQFCIEHNEEKVRQSFLLCGS